MAKESAKFAIGEVVHHRLFDYRGVIFDVDPVFLGSDEWYENVAKSRPPKDKPWYHVLVHDASHQTYVAERNLVAEEDHSPINHPCLPLIFSDYRNGKYIRKDRAN